MYDRPLRVTSRPNERNPLEDVHCRPITLVKGSGASLQNLGHAGYTSKGQHYQQGHVYQWGKARVRVVQMFDGPSSGAQNTQAPVSDEWLVYCSLLSTVEASSDGAASLLAIRDALERRVRLTK